TYSLQGSVSLLVGSFMTRSHPQNRCLGRLPSLEEAALLIRNSKMKAIQSAIEITNVLFLEQIRLCAGFWPPVRRIKPAFQKTGSGFQKLHSQSLTKAIPLL